MLSASGSVNSSGARLREFMAGLLKSVDRLQMAAQALFIQE